jgi:hypothetical protein
MQPDAGYDQAHRKTGKTGNNAAEKDRGQENR